MRFGTGFEMGIYQKLIVVIIVALKSCPSFKLRFGSSFTSNRRFWAQIVTFRSIELLGWGTTRRELKGPSGIAPKIQGDGSKNSFLADICFLLPQQNNATFF